MPGATWRMNQDDAFVWKNRRADVTLTQEGDHWRVAHAAVGRLMGPRRIVHEARHRRSDLAVWDVMAQVTRVCRNEEIAVRAGYDAAHWVNGRDRPADA